MYVYSGRAAVRLLTAVCCLLASVSFGQAWGAQHILIKPSSALPPPPPVVGQPFSYAFNFLDATTGLTCPAPMAISNIEGQPPDLRGLRLTPDGKSGAMVSGIPTSAGPVNINFQAFNPDNPQGPCGTATPLNIQVTVQAAPAPPPSTVAPTVIAPQAVAAVTAPSQQLSNIQQRLDNLRMLRNPTVTQGLNISYNGQAVPALSSMFGPVSPGKDTAAAPQTGGGASADRDPFEHWGVFVQGDLDVGKADTTSSQNGFDIHTKGLTVGADYRFAKNNVLGATLGFVKANTDLQNSAGNQDTKGWSLSVFGEWVPAENAYVDLALTYGQNKYDGVRNETQQSAVFSYDSSPRGNQFGVSLSAGYQFYHEAWTLTPYGRVEYIDSRIDAFQEIPNNGGQNPLSVSEQHYQSTVLTIGGQAQYAWSQKWGVLVPYARLELQYAAQSSTNGITSQYIGGVVEPVPIPSADKNYGNFSVGASAVLPRGLSGYFNYQYLFGKSNFSDSRYSLGISYEF